MLTKGLKEQGYIAQIISLGRKDGYLYRHLGTGCDVYDILDEFNRDRVPGVYQYSDTRDPYVIVDFELLYPGAVVNFQNGSHIVIGEERNRFNFYRIYDIWHFYPKEVS